MKLAPIRIVWKDSASIREYKPTKYRNHFITWYDNGTICGWTINIEGDCNVYKSVHCAMNAIDSWLGPNPRTEPSEKRKKAGIKIVGTI